MRRIIVVAALALAACAEAPVTVKVPDKVYVPTPVSCVQASDVPAYPLLRSEAELKALPDYQATLQLWLDAKAIRNYGEHAAVLLKACSEIQAATPPAVAP